MTKIIVGIFFIGSRKVNYGVKRKKNISSLFHKFTAQMAIYCKDIRIDFFGAVWYDNHK